MNRFTQITGVHTNAILGALFVGSLGTILGLVLVINSQAVTLSYDSTNPIIYDNDDTVDVYTDDYLMALSSAGDINLVGMITTSSVAPYNRYVTHAYFEQIVADRRHGVVHARNSGFRNIPKPVRGVKGHLRKPPSGQIGDTQLIGSAGSKLIVNEAKQATSDKPLVIVAGGPLTSVADAYLLKNSIADKVIVAWLGGNDHSMADYNGWADPWAAYIVLQKLKLVQFPIASLKPTWKDYMIIFFQKTKLIQFSTDATPYVPKSRLSTLPDTSLRKWMISKDYPLPFNELPGDMDADGPPAISVMREDYVLEVEKVSFGYWKRVDGRKVPFFRKDSRGHVLVVKMARRDVATGEWWRALNNSAAYHDDSSRLDAH